MCKDMSVIDWVAFVLVVVGGLNWGLVGFFDYNLVSTLFGDANVLSRVIFGSVGVATIYLVFFTCKGK